MLVDGASVVMRIRSAYGASAIVYSLVPEGRYAGETYTLEGINALKIFLAHWLETRIDSNYPGMSINSSREPEELPVSESLTEESPYIRYTVIRRTGLYNSEYGDSRVCTCGHSYYRHFDTYEHMAPIGCKYCGCREFKEAPAPASTAEV
jgi:hypothetical protein